LWTDFKLKQSLKRSSGQTGRATCLQTQTVRFKLGPKVKPFVCNAGRWDCWHKWRIYGWSCGSVAKRKQFQVALLLSSLLTLV